MVIRLILLCVWSGSDLPCRYFVGFVVVLACLKASSSTPSRERTKNLYQIPHYLQ